MSFAVRPMVVVFLMGSSLLGCVKQVVRVPPEAFVTLSGQRASYRDWSRVIDVCLVEPTVVTRDLDSMSALLATLLGQTSAGPEGVWADEHLAVLEQAARTLPVALDLERKALTQISRARCRFDGTTRATELNEQASKRLAEAPELLTQVRARKALAAWKASMPEVQQAAKDKGCAAPAKGQRAPPGPVVYAAFEDERGRTEWLFCDGAKVAAAPGNVPGFEAPTVDPSVKKPKKTPEPKRYLEAQARFPPADVSRAPRLPARKAAAAADGAAEPE